MNSPRTIFSIAAALILCLWTGAADARAPEVRNINVRGLQVSGTTTLILDGVELLPAPRVFVDGNAVEAVVDPSSTATRLVVAIKLVDQIVPGVAQLRVATADGFSNSSLVAIDRLPQVLFAEQVAALPSALHGTIGGSVTVRTMFSGKAGEDVIIEAEARRLGSKLRPVLHVFDAKRLQIAWASPTSTLSGDARLRLKLPADGTYSIELHDAQYAPPGPGFFRLKVFRRQRRQQCRRLVGAGQQLHALGRHDRLAGQCLRRPEPASPGHRGRAA